MALGALGEETANCDSVPESRRAMCVMVQACATLQDAARREECFRIAADSLGGDVDDGREQSQPPTMSESTVVEAPATDVADVKPQRDDAESMTVAVQEQPEQSRTARAFKELFRAPPASDEPSIPERFTAEVTAHRDLVHDRQLLVLDGYLLFEGDNAASSSIDVGDEVSVVKASSQRGRRYQIVGPSKRRFDALRIRCERWDLSADNRRKCDGMMGEPEI